MPLLPLFFEEQIPLCVPQPPKCRRKEKALGSVRDDTQSFGSARCGTTTYRSAPGSSVRILAE